MWLQVTCSWMRPCVTHPGTKVRHCVSDVRSPGFLCRDISGWKTAAPSATYRSPSLAGSAPRLRRGARGASLYHCGTLGIAILSLRWDGRCGSAHRRTSQGVLGLRDLALNGFFCFRSPVGNPYRILYLSINWEVFNTENFIHHKIWQKLNNNNNNNKENRPTCNLKGKIKLLSCYSAVHQVPFVQHKRTTCINYYKI